MDGGGCHGGFDGGGHGCHAGFHADGAAQADADLWLPAGDVPDAGWPEDAGVGAWRRDAPYRSLGADLRVTAVGLLAIVAMVVALVGVSAVVGR